MSDPRVLAVVPTCRGFKVPTQFIPVDWCIVHDQKEHEIVREEAQPGYLGHGYPAGKIHHIVAPAPAVYGWGTSAIRQAGLDWGYDEGYDYVLTLDDDCVIGAHWAEDHVNALEGYVSSVSETVPGEVIRGYTPCIRPVGISHGLWTGVLDRPAWYQLQHPDEPPYFYKDTERWRSIAPPFPMCGMNVGFRREVLPAVYFQHTFLRHDDIFAGWLAERVLLSHKYGFLNGGARVHHTRASNAKVNLDKETPGDAVNTALLEHVWGYTSTWGTIANTYEHLVQHLGSLRANSPELQFKLMDMVASMNQWLKRRRRG